MKMLTLKRSLPLAALVVAGALAPASVGAIPPQAQEAQAQAQQIQERTQSATQNVQAQRETMQTETSERANTMREAAKERKEQASGRLEEAKLKACQNREKAIQNIMTRLAERSTRQLEVFTKISDRTQAFYTEKGYTLENYDTLVADVNAKKAAAEATVTTVDGTSTSFACDGENPKGIASSFKESLHAQNAALKEYRTAIKNLITGVQSAAPTEEETTESNTTQESGDQQ